MNDQFNDFNMQNGNQNQSLQNNEPKPVKNKFFSEDLIRNDTIDSVGSSVSQNVNNRVISWGVGGKNNINNPIGNMSNNLSSNTNLNNEINNQMLNDVNSVIYTDEQPEILDDVFLYDNVLDDSLGIQNSTIFQNINESNSANEQIYSNQVVTNDQLYDNQVATNNTNNDNLVNNIADNSTQFGQNWMENQPLSAASLGVSSYTDSGPKDVLDEKKFFNEVNGNNNQTNDERMAQQVIQHQKELILDDPLPDIDEHKLLVDYVGKKYPKISMSPFSFGAFIFGGTYFIYRKMYLLGIILCFVGLVINYFVSFPTKLIVFFVFSVVLGIIVNPIYLKIVKLKVSLLRKKHKKENQIALSAIATKKGGTALIMFLVVGLIYSSLLSYLFYKNVLPELYDIVDTMKKEETVTQFDGNIYFEEYDIESKFNITLPSDFIKNDDKIFKYIYTDPAYVGDNKCIFTLGKVYGYESSEDLISKIASYNKKNDLIDMTTTSNIEWSSIYIEGENYNTHYLSTMVGDDVILLQYDCGVDTTSGVCDVHLVNILDSLSLKED